MTEKSTQAPAKPSIKARLEAMLAEYGVVAVVVWFGIFALVLAGFTVALSMGMDVEGTAGTAGTLGAAYVATQLTKPLRIGATLVITPFVAGIVRRFRGEPVRADSDKP